MLWLALHCPTLPLDCILRRWPEGLDPALAVSDIDGSRRLILVATRAAEACGVFAGQSIATALSLLPDLVLIARKLEDERTALVEAATAALRFTPTVSLRASGLVMEISSSLKLFGGRRQLKKSVAQAMQVQGLTIAGAEAPTPHGAWLLAQEHARRRLQADRRTRPSADGRSRKATLERPLPAREDGRSSRRPEAASGQSPAARVLPPVGGDQTATDPVNASTEPRLRAPADDTRPLSATDPRSSSRLATMLDALPIVHLETARPSLRRLDGIGCHTLADLRRLPVKGLARRFGPALIDEIARAIGDKPDPQVLFEAPSRFETRVELMARVETAEALVFASERLLEQLSGWLTARRAAVRGFTLRLHHDRWTRDAIEPTDVTIALSTPSSDAVRLSTLVRERLSRVELKAPVLELVLAAPAIVAERESHGLLFPEREQASETLARLLEKLAARLGPDALKRLERVADHRPERAWRELPGDLPPPASATPPRPADWPCGPRPAWLLAQPRQLEVRGHRPVFESLPLDLLAGPERIETGWWDDAPATRDYFIGENAVGRLVWVYCERLPTPGRDAWYLQGLFG